MTGWFLFYLYIGLMAYFLFFSERYGREIDSGEYRYNLEFLKEIKRFITYRKVVGFESFVINIVGNLVAFAPFGFMLPLLSKKYRKFFYITFLSLELSFFVELAQLLFKVGIFDVDDIFLNTIGGILGFLFYRICSFIFSKGTSKKRKSRKGD